MSHTMTPTPTLAVRDEKPAINVKDDTLWARDERTRKAIETLSEEIVETIYQGVVIDFWEGYASTAAEEYGYKFWADGRSSGWLVVDKAFLEYLDADDPWNDKITGDDEADSWEEGHFVGTHRTAALTERDRFVEFAQRIQAELDYCAEQFVERLNEKLTDETNIVRGDN